MAAKKAAGQKSAKLKAGSAKSAKQRPSSKSTRKKATRSTGARVTVAKKPAARRAAAGATRPKAAARVSGAGFAEVGGIGTDAVKKATGKGWAEWIALLDAANATSMSHKEIAAYLAANTTIGDWWAQMVTVGYEQARGMREKHQKPDGYEISVSKTLDVPVDRAFAAFEDAALRAAWLADPSFSIRVATPSKSMRADWVDGRTRFNVNWYAKGAGRSQVVVQHVKLKDAAAAEKMKAYWAKQLDSLRRHFEGGA